jgi:hypothetical protein
MISASTGHLIKFIKPQAVNNILMHKFRYYFNACRPRDMKQPHKIASLFYLRSSVVHLLYRNKTKRDNCGH